MDVVDQLMDVLQTGAQAAYGGEREAMKVGIDQRHEESGADCLARHFPPAVSEPVRLHVAAKRYLCATDPGYFARLSP